MGASFIFVAVGLVILAISFGLVNWASKDDQGQKGYGEKGYGQKGYGEKGYGQKGQVKKN